MVLTSTLSVEDLLKEYQHLLAEESSNTMRLEQQKLAILELLLEKLQHDSKPIFPCIKEDEPVDTYAQTQLKQISYYLLLAFGIFEDAANSFFFGSALFSLIPSISEPSLFIASIVYMVIESTLFYIYDSAELKDALAIKDPHTTLSSLITLYSKQLKAATAINQQLAMISALTMQNPLFLSYVELTTLINQDLKYKHQLIEKMDEPLWKKIIHTSVFIFGAISSLTGSYFMATTLMSLFYASLLSTPVGLGIVLVTMVVGIVFHYAMDTTSLTRMVNPDYEKFNELKEELQIYDQTFSDDLSHLKRLRARFEKKPMVDQSTQTNNGSTTQAQDKEIFISSHSLFKPKAKSDSGQNQPASLRLALPCSI